MFFCRHALGPTWPVDLSNLGAAIAYGYVSAAVLTLLRKEGGGRWPEKAAGVTYKDAFTRNYQRWSNMADKSPIDYELNRQAYACRNEAESAEQLAHWLERRIDFLNGVWHR